MLHFNIVVKGGGGIRSSHLDRNRVITEYHALIYGCSKDV